MGKNYTGGLSLVHITVTDLVTARVYKLYIITRMLYPPSNNIITGMHIRRGKLDSLFIVTARMRFSVFIKFFIFHILLHL